MKKTSKSIKNKIENIIIYSASLFILYVLFEEYNLNFFWFISVIAFIYINRFIHINIHEFGHFLMGKLFGLKLVFYSVGPFTWRYENGKMKFLYKPTKGLIGFCNMLSFNKKNQSTIQSILFISGGIILNFTSSLFVILKIGVLISMGNYLHLFLLIFSAVGFYLTIVNLIPRKCENHYNDGMRLKKLIFKKEPEFIQSEMRRISQELLFGTRPRDLNIDQSFIDKYLFDNESFIYILLYFVALDSSNDEDIIKYSNLVEDNLLRIPLFSIVSCYGELCFVNSMYQNKEKAEKYYELAGKELERDMDINGLRKKAYYEYYIKQNTEKARQLCKKALSVAEYFLDKGYRIMEVDLINTLLNTIDENTV